MSGGFSVLFTIWATFFPPTMEQARWALLGLAISCFVLGSYHVWARERRALVEEREKRRLPELKGEIIGIGTAMVTVGHRSGTLIFPSLEIRNIGDKDTVVVDWGLSVNLPDKSVPAVRLMLDDKLRVDMDDGPPIVLKSVDQIDVKCAEKTIAAGGRAIGILVYFLEGYRKEGIVSRENTIRLVYSDVLGRQYELIRPTLDETKALPPGTVPYHPGLNLWPELQAEPKRKEKTPRSRRKRR